MTAARTWLIAYDVRDDRRLRRLHRYLGKQARPLQYSVFVARLTPAKIDRIERGIRKIIDLEEDDVRCYVISPRTEIWGRTLLPDGVQVLGEMEGKT